MSSEGRVFPLLDRRAPLLERVRNGKRGPIGRQIASKLSDFLREDDVELKNEEIERIRSDFRSALANRLNVEEELISDTAVDRVTEVFSLSEDEVLIAVETDEESDSEEEDSDEEDDSSGLFGEE